MNKQQVTNLVGASTMAALIVGMGLILGGDRAAVGAQYSAETIVTSETTQLADVETLQNENALLQEAVNTLQLRDAEYASQIDLANQLLSEQAAPAAAYEDDDEYEYEEEDEDEYGHEEDEDEYEHEEEGDGEYAYEHEEDEDEYEEDDDDDDEYEDDEDEDDD